jgi:hypothetical protein
LTETGANFNPFFLGLLALGRVAPFAENALDSGNARFTRGSKLSGRPICQRIVQTLLRSWAMVRDAILAI